MTAKALPLLDLECGPRYSEKCSHLLNLLSLRRDNYISRVSRNLRSTFIYVLLANGGS